MKFSEKPVTVHRFPPDHRDPRHRETEQIELLASPRTVRGTYRAHREDGLRPFIARLMTIGLWCATTSDEVRS
jgi:hypothetical protein